MAFSLAILRNFLAIKQDFFTFFFKFEFFMQLQTKQTAQFLAQ